MLNIIGPGDRARLHLERKAGRQKERATEKDRQRKREREEMKAHTCNLNTVGGGALEVRNSTPAWPTW